MEASSREARRLLFLLKGDLLWVYALNLRVDSPSVFFPNFCYKFDQKKMDEEPEQRPQPAEATIMDDKKFFDDVFMSLLVS